VKCAWREGYGGLAACLAVAWDSQLSPVDTRSLRTTSYAATPLGPGLILHVRRPAKATLSKRPERALRCPSNC